MMEDDCRWMGVLELRRQMEGRWKLDLFCSRGAGVAENVSVVMCWGL